MSKVCMNDCSGRAKWGGMAPTFDNESGNCIIKKSLTQVKFWFNDWLPGPSVAYKPNCTPW